MRNLDGGPSQPIDNNHIINNDPTQNALVDIFSHLRDVSLRDGVQSWDSNKWPRKDIIAVAKEINNLAVAVKKAGGKLPPVEVWGGGQVVQPALYLKEDPFVNLQAIHRAMPDVDMQCLYRGRQCFGFNPVSRVVQEKAIQAAIERGMTHFRIFDFMNDQRNLEHGISILKEQKKANPNIRIEGAISYTMEPKDGTPPAWSHEDYAKYALELAKMGCDEIAIKNFAGKDDDKMPDLVKAIRRELSSNGYADMAVNLHSHGQKPDTLLQAVDAGAQKVDVAIGELSGGPAHTHMRDMVNLMLRQKGIDPESPDVCSHPIMQQLARTEKLIKNILHRRDKPVDVKEGESPQMTSLYERRTLMKTLFESDELRERIERSPMALGAISDIAQQRITEANWNSIKEPCAKLGINSRDELFVHLLDIADQLWKKSGQMGPVTPGAKILTDQAIQIFLKEELHNNLCTDIDTLPISVFTPDYKDVLTGRFGHNKGMEDKPLGDKKLRDAFMMYDALGTLEKAVQNGKVKDGLAEGAYTLAPLDEFCLLETDKQGIKLRVMRDAPKVQQAWKTVDITQFRNTVEKASWIDKDTKEQMLRDMTVGRSPDPTGGLEVGEQALAKLKREGIDVDLLHQVGKPVSSPDIAALLMMILPKPTQLFVSIAREPTARADIRATARS